MWIKLLHVGFQELVKKGEYDAIEDLLDLAAVAFIICQSRTK
jgi:hypothetical protein